MKSEFSSDFAKNQINRYNAIETYQFILNQHTKLVFIKKNSS